MNKIGIQIITAIILFCMIIPPAVSAANPTETHTEIINAQSINADMYDEVVNVANASSQKNYATWNPTPEGLWMGGSTEESLYQFNDVTAAFIDLYNNTMYSHLGLSWEVKFNTSNIMSGASYFVVRLPIFSDPDAIQYTNMEIYAIDNSDNYTWMYEFGNKVYTAFDSVDDAYRVGYVSGLNSSDVSVTDGDTCYTIDDRMYVNVYMPVYPGQLYLFTLDVAYKTDERFKVYFSPNDVANDEVANAHIVRAIPTAPDSYTYDDLQLTIDLGVSYDFRNGIGGNEFEMDFWLDAGDTVTFRIYSKESNTYNGYHTLMIPFRTSSGEANFSVEAKTRELPATTTISTGLQTWYGYILISDTTPKLINTTTTEGEYYMVTLTSGLPQRVSFTFEDHANVDMNDTGWDVPLHLSWMTYSMNLTDWCGVGGQLIHAAIYADYMVCGNITQTPVPGSIPLPVVIHPTSSTWTFPQSIEWGRFLVRFLYTGDTYEFGTYEIKWPGAFVYALNPGYGLTQLVANTFFGGNLPSLPDLFNNALDEAWKILQGLGNMIWAIGEMLYDAIMWLVDAIMEYGSYLLGMALVAIALLVLFFPIHYQLKLWTAALHLSQGKLNQASREVSDVAQDIGGKMGKVI
jgi:hypothetical protein